MFIWIRLKLYKLNLLISHYLDFWSNFTNILSSLKQLNYRFDRMTNDVIKHGAYLTGENKPKFLNYCTPLKLLCYFLIFER